MSDHASIPVTDRDRVCIVGAGHAGGELALALRQQGYTGSIVLCGSGRSGTSCHSMQIISDRRKNVSMGNRGKFGRNSDSVLALASNWRAGGFR